MHERELKKEWTEVSQVTDSALAECLTTSRDRGREHRESERQVSDGESERQRAEFGVFVWSELKEGLIFSSNGAFCTFFFFFCFLNFGLNRPFRPIRSIYADMAQVGSIQCESARVGASSARVGLKKQKPHGMSRWNTAECAGSSVPRMSPRPSASDAGVAPLVLRSCFTVFH